jgi:hypothetical protein
MPVRSRSRSSSARCARALRRAASRTRPLRARRRAGSRRRRRASPADRRRAFAREARATRRAADPLAKARSGAGSASRAGRAAPACGAASRDRAACARRKRTFCAMRSRSKRRASSSASARAAVVADERSTRSARACDRRRVDERREIQRASRREPIAVRQRSIVASSVAFGFAPSARCRSRCLRVLASSARNVRAVELGLAQQPRGACEADAPHERAERVERAMHRERFVERKAVDRARSRRSTAASGGAVDAHRRFSSARRARRATLRERRRRFGRIEPRDLGENFVDRAVAAKGGRQRAPGRDVGVREPTRRPRR